MPAIRETVEQVAERIGHFYRTTHFEDHPLAQGSFARRFFVGNEHETAPLFAQEHDDRCVVHFLTDDLGVGTDTDF
mgnify:CR=1 FL=1